MRFLKKLLDTLVPPHPAARVAAGITEATLMRLRAPRVAHGAHALFPYHDPTVRAMVQAIKFYGETRVLEPLGAIAAEELEALLEDRGLTRRATVVAPIPSSPARLRKRGYNQAERIARAIYEHLPSRDTSTYAPTLLAREDRTTQVRAQKSRAENIRGAFYVPNAARPAIGGARVILIDDVVKTGATLRDATRALKDAGAAEVIPFAIAY